MDQQWEPQDQSDELPFWPMYGTELLFELAVSEALASLAARIPPELFDDILFYVNVDRISQREWSEGEYLKRNRGEPSPKDILTDLKRCSFVCLFWANKCREHMFSGRTLEINSYEDAEIFRRHIIAGCPRLTPVHRLISQIRGRQFYKNRRSFIHLLYLPAIQDKLESLSIKGPVPDGFNHAKLDTPHWSIPPSVVVPGSFLRHDISISRLHLPSFYHVAKYIRHFSCATDIKFDTITWDGQMTLSLPHASNKFTGQRRPQSLEIEASGDCTNSVHLALTALMLNPNCPLHRLSDEERAWMIKFMTLLWGDKPDPDVRIGFDVSEQATTMRMNPFYFIFEEALSTDRSVSTLRVVGMHAYIYEYKWLPANFDALVNHVRTRSTIRALVLLFDSSDRLQKSIKPFVEVLALATGTIELVLAYEEWKERRAVGVDLATLEPSGRLWVDLPKTGLLNHDLKSLHILRSQLKKKIRGSAH